MAIKGMINTLYVDDRGDEVKFLTALAHIIFQDGTVNWGRVASLTSFGTAMCQYLKDKGRDNCVELVGEEISAYLLTHHKEWLVEHNSWVRSVMTKTCPPPLSLSTCNLMFILNVPRTGSWTSFQ